MFGKSGTVTKLLIIGMLIVMATSLFVVTSCGPSGDGATKTVTTTKTATQTVTTTAPAGDGEVYKLRLSGHHEQGTDIWNRVYVNSFANPLLEISDGQIEIELYTKGALVPHTDNWKGCSDGTYEMTLTTAAYISGVMPLGSMQYGLPGGLQNVGEIYTFWERGFEDLVQEQYNENNLYFITSAFDAGVGCMSTVPIESLADIEGMKVRMLGEIGSLWEALGASVVMMPGTELYTALQTGVIEAAGYGNAQSMRELGLQDVAKYYLLPHFLAVQETATWMANLETWNSLPSKVQKMIHDVAMNASVEYWRFRSQGYLEALADIRDNAGVTVNTLPGEDVAVIIQTAQQIWDDFANKGSREAEAVALLKAFLKDLGRL
jgi:TRAP-type mannitol/chloroaromatic compound transport system substrate-binding protein